MENTKGEKRALADDSEARILEPILVKIDNDLSAPCNIRIDKNEFKIGRSRDNDEIILNAMISRRHCVFRCEGNDEWTVKDCSSSYTFVNNVRLSSGIPHRLVAGDIIQFSECNKFTYIFTLVKKGEHSIKKPRIDERLFEAILPKEKTFIQNQELQKDMLKKKLDVKHQEQVKLKQELGELLKQEDVSNDKGALNAIIEMVENKVKVNNSEEQHLQNMYSQLLKRLEKERHQFNVRLNEERKKWQEELHVSKQEKEKLEKNMKEQMDKWIKQQQEEWKSIMENRVMEEKNKQDQLLNEKALLEQKLQETEKALKEQETKIEELQPVQNSNAITEKFAEDPSESCVFMGFVNTNDKSKKKILDTIDLTVDTQPSISSTSKENVLSTVSNIMDEQLTCSICTELFLKAITLNCMHTFCLHCINSWTKKRKECPVCRTPVKSMIRSLVLDNFIESMIDNLPPNIKARRTELIQERRALEKKRKRKFENYM